MTLVPRSLGALAYHAARLADERYAAAWQFRQYGYWIGRIDAVREMARADAMDELFAIVEYLQGVKRCQTVQRTLNEADAHQWLFR